MPDVAMLDLLAKLGSTGVVAAVMCYFAWSVMRAYREDMARTHDSLLVQLDKERQSVKDEREKDRALFAAQIEAERQLCREEIQEQTRALVQGLQALNEQLEAKKA